MSLLKCPGWSDESIVIHYAQPVRSLNENVTEKDLSEAFHAWLEEGHAQTDNEGDLETAFEAGADAAREGFVTGSATGRTRGVSTGNVHEMFRQWQYDTGFTGPAMHEAFAAGAQWQLEFDENY
mgnify:CR=1 FL=1|tara:strand:+ start:279 stop:650 length:372 start_codon:yes stop_codon:yes gene_type:complete